MSLTSDKFYLNLDSTKRNRTQYPNPANFQVQVNTSQIITSVNSTDPIVDAVPYSISTLAAGSTTTALVLNASASTINNFYINSYIQIPDNKSVSNITNMLNSQTAVITGYTGATQTAVVTGAFTYNPPASTQYVIRNALPYFTDIISLPLPNNTTTIWGTFQFPTNYFPQLIGSYLRISSSYTGTGFPTQASANVNQIRQIVSFNLEEPPNGPIQYIVNPGFPAEPSLTDSFEIMSWSRDNELPLSYAGNKYKIEMPYQIRLMSLILPIQTFNISYGGTIQNYPEIYLKLENVQKHYSKPIATNNVNTNNNVLFKLAVEAYNYNSATNFVTLTSHDMKPIVKWNPYDNIIFTIYMPDGSIMSFVTNDNVGTFLPPNPFLQIKALFEMKRIKTAEEEKKEMQSLNGGGNNNNRNQQQISNRNSC